ncbi:hypothetical protein BY996DRAFT_4084042 [Phakopsora pachyrhizi]|nr:hypothetical protein BY996DRAFT_4084042 [Phakopsora pachyrhizi]
MYIFKSFSIKLVFLSLVLSTLLLFSLFNCYQSFESVILNNLGFRDSLFKSDRSLDERVPGKSSLVLVFLSLINFSRTSAGTAGCQRLASVFSDADLDQVNKVTTRSKTISSVSFDVRAASKSHFYNQDRPKIRIQASSSKNLKVYKSIKEGKKLQKRSTENVSNDFDALEKLPSRVLKPLQSPSDPCNREILRPKETPKLIEGENLAPHPLPSRKAILLPHTMDEWIYYIKKAYKWIISSLVANGAASDAWGSYDPMNIVNSLDYVSLYISGGESSNSQPASEGFESQGGITFVDRLISWAPIGPIVRKAEVDLNYDLQQVASILFTNRRQGVENLSSASTPSSSTKGASVQSLIPLVQLEDINRTPRKIRYRPPILLDNENPDLQHPKRRKKINIEQNIV